MKKNFPKLELLFTGYSIILGNNFYYLPNESYLWCHNWLKHPSETSKILGSFGYLCFVKQKMKLYV